MTTGDTIRILRAVKKLTQPQLSYLTHLSQFTICSIETGRRQPTAEQIAALEKGLGMKFTDPRLTRGLQLIEEALA